MSGSTKTTQSGTSTNTVDPAELAMLQNNYTGAQARAASLTPYTGQMVADFNSDLASGTGPP